MCSSTHNFLNLPYISFYSTHPRTPKGYKKHPTITVGLHHLHHRRLVRITTALEGVFNGNTAGAYVLFGFRCALLGELVHFILYHGSDFINIEHKTLGEQEAYNILFLLLTRLTAVKLFGSTNGYTYILFKPCLLFGTELAFEERDKKRCDEK